MVVVMKADRSNKIKVCVHGTFCTHYTKVAERTSYQCRPVGTALDLDSSYRKASLIESDIIA